jgi:hypothetical protein
VRDAAGAWLPPGFAAETEAAESDDGEAVPDAGFATEDEPHPANFPDDETASDDLPAFLTGDDQVAAG